eukprot:CAMPEP_0197558758 /NCGR_PEP_ID=MMETSP1320-20131121/19892_1 /TAXON_ID=91990 /ORGANISM="Bolidomonas sp., Strain RCC2347" /LENGTH=70 /DNA_ID=CAMNT_0043120097 /DNA_START=62 /DNA_END=271 /DNA_ORIENTATION=-
MNSASPEINRSREGMLKHVWSSVCPAVNRGSTLSPEGSDEGGGGGEECLTTFSRRSLVAQKSEMDGRPAV